MILHGFGFELETLEALEKSLEAYLLQPLKGSSPPPAESDSKQRSVTAQITAANKKFSQLLAKSWLPKDHPDGRKLRDILLRDPNNPDSQTKSDEIKKFLRDNLDVPKPLHDFIDKYSFIVVWNTFAGTIRERPLLIEVPYPPRPSDFDLDTKALVQWIGEESTEKPMFPATAYIPLSTYF